MWYAHHPCHVFICALFHISLSTELCVDGCRRTNKQETVHWKLFLPLFILTKLHNAPFTHWNQSSFTFNFFESSSTHLTIYLFSHNPSSLPISSDLSSHGSIFSHIHLLPSSCLSPCPLILPLLKLFRRTCNKYSLTPARISHLPAIWPSLFAAPSTLNHSDGPRCAYVCESDAD